MANRKKLRQKLSATILPEAQAYFATLLSQDSKSYRVQESRASGSVKTSGKILKAVFHSAAHSEAQKISFSNWQERSEFAETLIPAFEKVSGHVAKISRSVRKSQLNQFLYFLNKVDPQNRIKSPNDLKPEHPLLFKAFLDQSGTDESTRRRVWSTFRLVAMEILAQSHCDESGREAILIPLSPWPKAGRRGPHVKAVRRVNALQAVFPRGGGEAPQTLDFTPWRERGEFGIELVKAFTKINYHLNPSTRKVRRVQLGAFLRFLDHTDPKKKIATVTDFTTGHVRSFKEFLDKTNAIDRTRKKVWAVFRAVVSEMVAQANEARGSNHQIPIAKTPWPGASRRGVHTKAMSIGDAGRLLRACLVDMKSTMQAAARFGPHYQGPSVAELVPFIVTLAFWTNFNPDTVVGIKLSNIRPPVLGRIAIVAEKGRSNRDQVATFPQDDTHLCSPPVLVRNIIQLTSVLRDRCTSRIKDHLFIGRILNTNSISEIEAYAYINSATQSHHRKIFAVKHGLKVFSLQKIRTTGARISNAMFGDDVKTTQILLNHLSVNTTDDYTQEGAKAREALNLADQMEMRNRFVRTDGARDPRGQPTAPQSAATPGFVCADPYNPPQELGQEPGMCAAYGACPTCPLVGVDRTCPTSLALVLRIRNQLKSAAKNPDTDPYRWTRIWKPRLNAIEQRWLPMFGDDVQKEASAT
jgi:hypothetical protein